MIFKNSLFILILVIFSLKNCLKFAYILFFIHIMIFKIILKNLNEIQFFLIRKDFCNLFTFRKVFFVILRPLHDVVHHLNFIYLFFLRNMDV